jgi:RNA polymerase primary sigma factor
VSHYRNPALRQFKEFQIQFAPRADWLKQIERAEGLLNELNPESTYRFPELFEKIASNDGNRYPDVSMTGREAMHDLRVFVEDLSDSADIAVENAGEEVWTVEDVSRRYNVSTKTVARWRDKGLVSRRFVFGGRKRVCFLKSSVERFVSKHSDDVDRGSKFTQVSLDEREKLIEQARQLARSGGRPTEISERLARRFGRSPVTVRYTLKHFDREHPESAVFPSGANSMSEDQRREIHRRFNQGVSVETLARELNRSRASLYRLLAEVRAEQVLTEPIDFMDAPDFHVEGADQAILGEPPQVQRKSTLAKAPAGLPPYLESLYSIALLTREEEVYYFRKMNYLKFKASEMRKELDPIRPRSRDMDEIERMLRQANDVKNLLIRCNLRLVVSIARKHFQQSTNFFETVSDGNMSLIRAIERFDFTRGFKFSTYASWAIIKNFARSIPAERTQLDRFRTGSDEVFSQSFDGRSAALTGELVNRRQHEALMGILAQLSTRERDIIVCRYGLNGGTSPQTLEQVGSRFGVTKERIRQLETRALTKLRKIAETERLDVPGI